MKSLLGFFFLYIISYHLWIVTVLCWIGVVRVDILVLFQIVVEELSTFLWLLKWSESPSVVSDSLWPHGLYSPWNSPGQKTGVGSLSLFQGIFPTRELNRGLLPCRQILYQLSYESSNIILLLSISPFKSVNICFIYLGCPILGAEIFTNVISSYWIDRFIM